MWFIGIEVEQETSAPPPKKNPGSAPGEGGDGLAKDKDEGQEVISVGFYPPRPPSCHAG